MQSANELKKIYQLSKEELQTKAQELLDNYIEPLVIEAIKNYQDTVSIKLNYDLQGDTYLYGYPTPGKTQATPLDYEILKYVERCLEEKNYEVTIADDKLWIEWK